MSLLCALIVLQLLSTNTEYRNVQVMLKVDSEVDADLKNARYVVAGSERHSWSPPAAAVATPHRCALQLPLEARPHEAGNS